MYTIYSLLEHSLISPHSLVWYPQYPLMKRITCFRNPRIPKQGRRLNLQHREGSICNTPNDLILAQFATQRWLNLQHTKIYKQPFRFNWVGTGLICAHRSDSSVHTTGSWRLICTRTHTHTHTQVKNERHT